MVRRLRRRRVQRVRVDRREQERFKRKRKRGLSNLLFPRVHAANRIYRGKKRFRDPHIDVYAKPQIRAGKNWANKRRNFKIWFLIKWIFDYEFYHPQPEVKEFYIDEDVNTSYNVLKRKLAKQMIPYVEARFKSMIAYSQTRITESPPVPVALRISVFKVIAGKQTSEPWTVYPERKRKVSLREAT